MVVVAVNLIRKNAKLKKDWARARVKEVQSLQRAVLGAGEDVVEAVQAVEAVEALEPQQQAVEAIKARKRKAMVREVEAAKWMRDMQRLMMKQT